LSRSRGRLASVVAALFALVLTASSCASGPKPPSAVTINSMGAMGDSISRAFDACTLLADCPAKSWTTGTDPTIGSHYERLLARNPAMSGRVYNVSKVGATSADLSAQATALASSRPDYVTLQIGANDACAASESAMTTPTVFRARIDAALTTLYAANPHTRVLVTSVPDLYRLWQVAHTNRVAQLVWSYGFCRTMLDNPTSVAPTDEARRQLVRARVISYNDQLAAACGMHSGCRYDGGAVFDHQFLISDLSPYDFFHPNATGQKTLAAITWPKSGL
jgi:lysophospholipase L1-like esterase